jgi:hypothetical protein
MNDAPRLPTEAEQMAAYRERRAAFEAAYAKWVDDGRIGPPPSHPVRPHTPGRVSAHDR